MTAVNEEILRSNCETLFAKKAERQDVVKTTSGYWYILRYKTLDKLTTESLINNPSIFFPCRTERRPHRMAGKMEYVDKPLVPGYLFVHAQFEDAKRMSAELNLPLWKKKGVHGDSSLAPRTSLQIKAEEARSYYTISNAAMQQFIKVIEALEQDIKMLDASCIDLEKDDMVEIVSGEFKGCRGYLKSINESNGGLVVVPVKDENGGDIATTIFSYGIPTHSSEIAILSFAKGSRRATDQLNHAGKVVEKLMEAYVSGEIMKGKQKSQLMGYVHRFEQVQLERPIQRVRLALLLYRTYTLLEMGANAAQMRKQLEEEILPECEQRKNKASNRDRASAEKTYAEYIEQKQQADTAYESRQKALADPRRKKTTKR